jgi:hypothetical protein
MTVVALTGNLRRAPEVISVLLDDLFLDYENYQRPTIESHVAKLVLNWDDYAAGLLTVNLREDNVIALIDGQHRMLAARGLGHLRMRAYAYSGLTPQEEGRLFLKLNKDRRHHTAIQKWRVEINTGNPLHVALDSIVHDCGFTISQVSKNSNPRSISAPDTLMRIAAPTRGSTPEPERLRSVLTFIKDTWPDDPSGAPDILLLGVSSFLYKYGAVLNVRMASHRLSKYGVAAIVKKTVLIRDSLNVNRTRACVLALQQFHDLGMKSTNRLEHLTTD